MRRLLVTMLGVVFSIENYVPSKPNFWLFFNFFKRRCIFTRFGCYIFIYLALLHLFYHKIKLLVMLGSLTFLSLGYHVSISPICKRQLFIYNVNQTTVRGVNNWLCAAARKSCGLQVINILSGSYGNNAFSLNGVSGKVVHFEYVKLSDSKLQFRVCGERGWWLKEFV